MRVENVTPPPGDGDRVQPYDAFAQRVIVDGVLLDPWIDGEPRLSPEPLVLLSSAPRL